MGKLEQPMTINWAQFITTIAVSFIVSAGGATVALMTSQASTEQRIIALESRAVISERTNERLSETIVQVRESLARIEGALEGRKK